MKNRDHIVDIYKGIGIVLVMMGHIGFGDTSSYIAHAFHMPMFFLISGFLYHEKEEIKMGEWMWQKVVSLLCPYFIFGFMNYGVFLMMQLIKKQSLTLNPLKHLFFINTTGLASGSLWFLTALLTANILFFLLRKITKNNILLGMMVFAVSYMGIWAAANLPMRLPYAMDAGMVGLGLLYVGYLLQIFKERKIVQEILHLSPIKVTAGVIFFSILILQNGEINMRKGLYHNTMFFWLNAIAGSVLIYSMSVLFDKIKSSRFLVVKWPITLVEEIGRYSLIYVGMNDLACAEIKYFLKCIFTGESKLNTIVVHSATLLIAFGIIEFAIHCTPLTRWMDEIKERLCGKIKS